MERASGLVFGMEAGTGETWIPNFAFAWVGWGGTGLTVAFLPPFSG